jgi:hypothetical protein
MRIITQNGTAVWKIEREARAREWHAACEEVESRLGRPTPGNVSEFRKALEDAELRLGPLAYEADVSYPSTSEALAALLNQTGAYALVLEEHEGEVVGVLHVPSA